MAFGGGGGGGFSFGSNNNNQSSGFGGFGGNNNTSSAFGSTNAGGGFGSSTTNNPFSTGGNAFGSSTTAPGGFGSSSAGGGLFGGNKPAATSLFGSTNTASNTGGGLFGNTNTNNASTGFGASTGGFGSNANNSAFGNNSGTAGGFSGFGNTANKSAFGSGSSATTLFGQGGSGTTGGFGANTGNAFGGSGTALGQNIPPSQGTAVVPFQPTNEKDNAGTIAYQSISFMEPYNKYSPEELRLADYNGGRQFGNGAGQPAGGFGSSGFGGFGSNNNTTGGFGASNTASNNLFGGNTTSASGGFGSNSSNAFSSGGGGLFGQNKPTTGGGLFGQQASTNTSTGGLFRTNTSTAANNPFGASTNTTGGFGATSSGGGLFGNTNQPKPGGLFGNNSSTTTGTSNFAFGQNNQQQANTSSGGLFGNSNSQTGGGLFGANSNNNQQKPGGIFGNSTAGGFGANTAGQTANSGGLFSASTNTGGGGLFGNNNATVTNNTNTSGGLFGNTQASNTGGGLFGNNNANTQSKPGGLFGNSTFGAQSQSNTGGGGLFGNNNQASNSGGLFGNANNTTSNAFNFSQNQNKPAGGSLFGPTSTNNNQSGGLFSSTNNNSMFGNSMNQSQQQSQGDVKHASLLDNNAYGQSSIWTGLPSPTQENSKPLVTPLVAAQNLKESQSKPPPNLRLNQSRYMTPPRRGYGFTYSTYGTPSSAASTPGGNSLSTSMYGSRFTGGSFGRSMAKSASISNMRSLYSEGESVLAPGAFTPSSSRYSSGSIRRLTIDRSIRDDLFSRPALPAPANNSSNSSNVSPAPKTINGASSTPSAPVEPAQEATGSRLKKRVSFDKDTTGGQNGNLNANSGALVRVESDEDAGSSTNGTVTPPDTSRGNSLAAVPEDRESEHAPTPKPAKKSHGDPAPGEYWSKPTEEELKALPRDQASHFRGLQVGRQGCGFVTFDEPVDLTPLLPLSNLFGSTIVITVRSMAVYPDSATKPPRGKGLNVPSTITMENSWPRNKGKPEGLASGPAFDKHIRRLKAIHNTEFISYDVNTGLWVFRVPHYTRYGLDYDDDDDEDFGTSQLSAPPDSIKAPEDSVMEVDSDHTSEFGEEDTFHGKQLLTVPGGYGRQSAIEVGDDSVMQTIEHDSPRSEQSAYSEDGLSEDDMDMAGSYPVPNELDIFDNAPVMPNTPGKALLDIDLEGDWAEQLQRTISPRKQNREALREAQNKVLLDREFAPIKPATIGKKSFKTSIDVMHALFDKNSGRTDVTDFELPYAKRAKLLDSNSSQMTESDKAWHTSFKPLFTSEGKLVLKSNGAQRETHWNTTTLARSHNRSIVMTGPKKQEPQDIAQLTKRVSIEMTNMGIPEIQYTRLPFSVYGKSLAKTTATAELHFYELLHVLFDDYEDIFNYNLSEELRRTHADQIRKDRVSGFLSKALSEAIIPPGTSGDPIDIALQHITSGNSEKASQVLLESKNITLALLVAQLPNADEVFQNSLREQIDNWREQNVLSEIELNIRAIYELLSGNTTVSQGKAGAVEHKAATFSISEQFSLGWLTMFAVNFWYGTHKNDNVEAIIDDFSQKLSSGEEVATPVGDDGSEDPLWIALRLFALSKGQGDKDDLVFPEALSGLGQLDEWNSLPIFRALYAILSCLDTKDDFYFISDRQDELVATTAAEFEFKSDIPGAAFALLHLQDPESRGEAVVKLLLRNAARLPSAPNLSGDQTESKEWKIFTKQLCIPEQWLYQALALLARSESNADRELRYLIFADEINQAHECLVERVAPVYVVDQDWEGLQEVLNLFLQQKDTAGLPRDWNVGGAVYNDFCKLVDGRAADSEKKGLLNGVRKGVAQIGSTIPHDGRAGDEGIEIVRRRVAVREMARLVVETDDERTSVKAVLDLPLTSEIRGRLRRDLAGQYFVKVMSG